MTTSSFDSLFDRLYLRPAYLSEHPTETWQSGSSDAVALGFKQGFGWNSQCRGYDANIVEPDVTDAPFDARNVGPVQPALEREVLLRHAALFTQPLDVPGEDLSKFHAFEATRM